ncbi:MAG: hypothetical protein HRT61_20850 [Ekhidna sp.]|nr:hypothetical protein [Ekhidna sp.]
MDKNEAILKQSIQGLKQSEAPDIWSSIETELNSQEEANKEVLLKAINALGSHEAPDVWTGVSEELQTKSQNTWKYLAIAASVSLVAVLSLLFLPNQSSETLSYSSEQVEFFDVNQPLPTINSHADDMLLTYIKENCTRLAATCQDPEFKELLEAYMELDETKQELKQTLEQANDPTQIMKYLIKVEKSQTELGKDMLQKMKSI